MHPTARNAMHSETEMRWNKRFPRATLNNRNFQRCRGTRAPVLPLKAARRECVREQGKEPYMRSLALAAVAAVAFTGSAQASVIPFLNTVTADGSNFKFSYTGQLAPDQGVTNGSELVIVDFAGYVPGSVFSSLPNVTASVSNTLPTGLLLNPGFTDNPTIPDLVFTYTGPNFQTTGGPFSSITNFAGLGADSIFGQMGAGSFSAKAVTNVGPLSGTAAFNVGEVNVPAVPEPATWAMMLVGFFGLGALL